MYNLFQGLSGSPGPASFRKVLTPKGYSEATVQINIWNWPSGKSLMVCGRHMAWLLGWSINEAFHSCPDSRKGKPRGQTSVWLTRLLCEWTLSSVFQARISFTAQKRACVCSFSQQWGAQGSALASGCFHAPSQVPTRPAATLPMHASSHHMDACAVLTCSIGKEIGILTHRVTFKWRCAYMPRQRKS